MQKENDIPPIKFFVNDRNKVTIRCPKCGLSKTVDAANLKNARKRLRVTCKCGETFRGIIEFRRYYRKAVKLTGEYMDLNSPKRGDLIVVDLSMGGLGFTCDSSHRLQPGDFLEVSFKLDDAKQSDIKLKVKVRSVKGKFVGAERIDKLALQRALGFYLM